MDAEIKFAAIKLGLETKMERIDSSYREIYGNRPDVPTAKNYTELYLNDNLPWETKTSVMICSYRARTFFISSCRTMCTQLNKRGTTQWSGRPYH
jgi:hypothetical protein